MDNNCLPKHIAEIFSKINEVRTTPLKMANKLTLTMSYINKRDNVLREPNKPIIKLTEGMKAYEEAINYLKAFKSAEPLTLEESITSIAQEHADDIGHKGLTGNDSSDIKIKFLDRFKRIGTFSEVEEILAFNEIDPLRVVMDLIVCDKDPNRTNRNTILNSNLNQIGIGYANHSKYNNVIVIDILKNWKVRIINSSINNVAQDESLLDKKETNASSAYLKTMKNFKLDLNNNTSLNEVDNDLIEQYDKELDSEIFYDNYIEKKEEKHIIEENTNSGNKIKIIKKITFIFKDMNPRKVILSKTFLKNNNKFL